MAMIEAIGVTYRYSRHTALDELDLEVPDGALYALLGPNGSGKTTLMKILIGLLRPMTGRVSIAGVDSRALTLEHRARIGYIAEGQSLPQWMRLEQVEAYLAPLYPTWDPALARDLRARFGLDPSRKIGVLSRGEQMKAALLMALAPRPRVLIMDEPFTGMDALVKDELVRGLLESTSNEGWTVLIASHDIGELELLSDWVGFLARGRLRLSEPMETLKQRIRHVEIVSDGVVDLSLGMASIIDVERAGTRITAIVDYAEPQSLDVVIREHVPQASRVHVREATLREIFVALAKRAGARSLEAAA